VDGQFRQLRRINKPLQSYVLIKPNREWVSHLETWSNFVWQALHVASSLCDNVAMCPCGVSSWSYAT